MDIIYKLFRKPWQQHRLSKYRKIVAEVNALEHNYIHLIDKDLEKKVRELYMNAQGSKHIYTLIPEALAVAREFSSRMLNMRPYDVQLIGTLALYEGHIAEMDTGEGKTLLAPLAAFLHQIEEVGRCTHIVTANEYLAQRDAEWMMPLYQKLNLSVGLVLPEQKPSQRADAYKKQVVYATAREVVFDSMRQTTANKAMGLVDTLLRPNQATQFAPNYDFVIVDEVDSVLIDQARSPLSIGSASAVSPNLGLYKKAEEIAGSMVRGTHYRMMQDDRSIELKDEGKALARSLAGSVLRLLPTGHKWERYVTCALAVRYIYKVDQHYVIKDKQVVLIDESTGRLMPGRQLQEGIHQALEVRNELPPSAEMKGSLSTTFQTFFRKYKKISGMTGSASSSASEFKNIYKLNIVPIPPHQLRKRVIHPDKVYRTIKTKFQATISEVEKYHKTGRPILIGTGSVQTSEIMSQLLTDHGLTHEVLNAKNHLREAEIITDAGIQDRITIITNMAGRGVDIKLGDGVAAIGGMMLISTDRSPFHRLDDQLTGRVGRQGDPGDCIFLLSLRDDILYDKERKSKCRLRQKSRTNRNAPIEDVKAITLFSNVQKHYNKLGIKQRKKVYDAEVQKEKLKSEGLWEDWMST
jgi:preprotein translocase subunit SecA